MKTVTLAKGGAAEKVVRVEDIEIPDMWHLAMRFMDAYKVYQKQLKVAREHGQNPIREDPDNPDPYKVTIIVDGEQCKVIADMILECWHLADDLLKNIREEELAKAK